MAIDVRSLLAKLFGPLLPDKRRDSAKAMVLKVADSFRDQGNAASAALKYREALSIDPDDLDVRKQYANMLKDIASYDEAFGEYNFVLAKRPNDSDTYLQLGHLSKLRGDRAATIRYYEQAATGSKPSGDAIEELRRLTGGGPTLILPSAVALLHSSEGATAARTTAGVTVRNSGVDMSNSSRELQEVREQLGELRRELNELRSLLAPEWGSLAQFSARRQVVLSEIDNRWRTFVPFMLRMTSAVARLGADVERLSKDTKFVVKIDDVSGAPPLDRSIDAIESGSHKSLKS